MYVVLKKVQFALLRKIGEGKLALDSNGRTPLLYAVITRATGVVKLLLRRPEINPNLSADDGRTPVFFAAWRRYLDIVNLLLERDDINPDLPDRNGRTLLSFAAEWGREGLVKQLLERGDVNPDLPDSNGQKPLSYAARKGREGIVRLLSNSTTLNCEWSEDGDRMPTAVADENASREEATHPLLATETITLHTDGDPPPLKAPISGSILSEPLPEKALPLEQPSPEQLPSPIASPSPLPFPGSPSGFSFFLYALIPLLFLFFALIMCHGYGDSHELFRVIHSAWQ